MSECKHCTQTERTHTYKLQKGEYVLIGISLKIPTRWYAGHIHWTNFVKNNVSTKIYKFT